MNPWPRRIPFLSALAVIAVVAALAPRSRRASRPAESPVDLRDSVAEHRALLSAGHSAFTCGACHIAHKATAARPLWQKQGGGDASLFVRDSQAAGGVKTGLCMSCHDGTIAPTITAHMTSSGGTDLGANHPVGVDYLAAVRGNPGSFNEPDSNPRIVLEDGKVSCISCHSTHDIGGASGGVRQEVCVECHRR